MEDPPIDPNVTDFWKRHVLHSSRSLVCYLRMEIEQLHQKAAYQRQGRQGLVLMLAAEHKGALADKSRLLALGRDLTTSP